MMKKMIKIFLIYLLLISINISTVLSFAELGDNPALPPAEKKIVSVSATPTNHTAGNLGSVTVTVATMNVENGTSVTAQLVDGSGPVEGVETSSGLISNNEVKITLPIPTLVSEGSYHIKVSIAAINLSDETAVLTVVTGTAGITNVQLEPSAIVMGNQKSIAVKAYTSNVKDGTTAIISITDFQNNDVMSAGSTSTKVQSNYFYTTLIIPATLSAGTYRAKIHVDGVTPDHTGSLLTISEAPNSGGSGTLSSEKKITSFWFELDGAGGVIDENQKTVHVTVPYGTDVKTLIPNILISDNAVISPQNRVMKDFTSPVKYTVTAEDGTTQDYMVTVVTAPPKITPTPTLPPNPPPPPPGGGPGVAIPTPTPTPTPTPSIALNTVKVEADVNKITGEIEATVSAKLLLETSEDKNANRLLIESESGSMMLDKEALRKVAEAIGKNSGITEVNFSIGKVDPDIAFEKLSEADKQKAEAEIGDRPIYDINISAGNSPVSNFGSGEIQITVPYTLRENEDPNSIVIYFINAQGNLEVVRECVYDAVTKTISFKTSHLSLYAAASKAVGFTDVADDFWAKPYITFLASRGIMEGYQGYANPDAKLTRAQFAKLLASIEKIDISQYTSSSFSDVSNQSIFMPYVSWASANGIIYGTGNGKFDPDAPITREQVCVMAKRYMDKIAKKPLQALKNPSAINDKDKITKGEIYDAVMALNNAGIIVGNKNIFNPKGLTTRAEAAKILTLLIKEMMK